MLARTKNKHKHATSFIQQIHFFSKSHVSRTGVSTSFVPFVLKKPGRGCHSAPAVLIYMSDHGNDQYNAPCVFYYIDARSAGFRLALRIRFHGVPCYYQHGRGRLLQLKPTSCGPLLSVCRGPLLWAPWAMVLANPRTITRPQ